MSWELLDTLSVEGVVSCIRKAKKQITLSEPILIHSDRRSQYVSIEYKRTLGNQFITSYSQKGKPREACIESFHALIKREWLNNFYFKNINEIRNAVFEYIEVFYNRTIIHSTLDYKSPVGYELRYTERN